MKLSLAGLTTVLALVAAPVAALAEAPPTSVVSQLKAYQAAAGTTKANLKTFDTLDFDVYSNQKWDRLKESHSADILVHYPDGSTTKGLEAHVAALKPMFVFAPDARVTAHPVRFGDGSWTGVIGVMEGTFSQPMPIGDGKFIQPTGKHYRLEMSTLGHWTKAGVMDEEYLFWDNAAFMKQIGAG
ncbi:hypothetical protein BH10PSE3_BH10PSE3_05980 [soil metagenome]